MGPAKERLGQAAKEQLNFLNSNFWDLTHIKGYYLRALAPFCSESKEITHQTKYGMDKEKVLKYNQITSSLDKYYLH